MVMFDSKNHLQEFNSLSTYYVVSITTFGWASSILNASLKMKDLEFNSKMDSTVTYFLPVLYKQPNGDKAQVQLWQWLK